MNPELLAADFQHHSTHFSSADEAVDYYNSHLSSLLDLHAPVKTRTVTFTRSAPWFTDELCKMKAAGRVLEQRLKASDLTVHKQIYQSNNKNMHSLSKRHGHSFTPTPSETAQGPVSR